MLIDQLRQRNQLQQQATQARADQQTYANTMPQNSQPVVGSPGFTTNIGGHMAQMPGETQVNYGDIVGRGVANYMSAKAGKDAISKEAAVKDLNTQFMTSSLQGDDVAQKLFAGAQAGIPGMAQALTTHLAPKKEAMGSFLQYLQSENPSPDIAEQVATKFGVDPAMARKASEMQNTFAQQKRDNTVAQKSDLLTQKGQQQTDLQLLKGSQQEKIAGINAANKPVRETEQSKLTARQQAKAKEDLLGSQGDIEDVKHVIEMARNAKWNPLNMGLAPDAINPNGVMAKQALSGLTLKAMGNKLGAGISNADRDFMQAAQVNFDKGNVETATAQLNQVLTRLNREREKNMRLSGQDPAQGAPDMTNAPKSQYDYPSSKNLQQKYGKQPLPPLDDIIKEYGE